MYKKQKNDRSWYLLKNNKTIAIFILESDIDEIIKMNAIIKEAESFDILADTEMGVY